MLSNLQEKSQIIPPFKKNYKKRYYPLSFQQQRMYFFSVMSPNSNIWNEYFCIPFNVPIEKNKLIKALEYTINKHTVLRSKIKLVKEVPYQFVDKSISINVEHIRLSGEKEELSSILELNNNKAFNIYDERLCKFYLIERDASNFLLQIVRHHIISDATSDAIISKEIFNAYFSPSLKLDTKNSLSQYYNFAIWQNEYINHEFIRKQEEYWLKEFSDASNILKLPIDYPRPEKPSFNGGKIVTIVNSQLTKEIKLFAFKQKTNIFSFLLLNYFLLLKKLSDQDDIVVGTPFNGRNLFHAFTQIAGVFVNTIPIRLSLPNDTTFSAILDILDLKVKAAYDNQYYPFEKLVQKINPPRENGISPIFQVWFNLLPGIFNETDFDILNAIYELNTNNKYLSEQKESYSRYDISLYCKRTHNYLIFEWVYNKDIFKQERIQEFVAQFHTLLEQTIKKSDKSLDDYSILTEAFKLKIDDPSLPIKEEQLVPIHYEFSEIANRQPDRIAISQDDNNWTYKELENVSNRIAKSLIKKGLKKHETVCLYGQKSFGLIAGIIGVLKGGGVFITLNNKQPNHRNYSICKAAGSKIVLFINEVNSEIIEESNCSKYVIDSFSGDFIEKIDISGIEINFEVKPSDPAYIFFTSGTTGVPKGIIGYHKGLSHFIKWQKDEFNISANERVSLLTSLSFDPILRDIFLPLSSGSTLCIPDDDLLTEPFKVIPWLQKNSISIIHTVPSLAQLWYDSVNVKFKLNLKIIFFAGEPLKPSLVKLWENLISTNSTIVNLYGPTETIMVKCFYILNGKVNEKITPIGKAISFTNVFVMNRSHEMCGMGEIGEIVIRTPYKGDYLNINEEKSGFKKNPFTNSERDIVYFTGDLGRYNPDGELEIIERKDHQVKINGIRIELKEIELYIDKHPAIKKNVVLLDELNGSKKLVSYITTSDEISTLALRQYLREHLPDYMIPSVFVKINEIPLNINGKIDYASLRKIGIVNIINELKYIKPENPIEKTLVQIWQDVLKIEKVGVMDNFFDLGGHSFLVIKAISEINKKLGVSISFGHFTKQSLGQIAESCAEKIKSL